MAEEDKIYNLDAETKEPSAVAGSANPEEKVEDIFAEVEAGPVKSAEISKTAASRGIKPRKNYFRIIIILVIAAAIGFGLWQIWPKIKNLRFPIKIHQEIKTPESELPGAPTTPEVSQPRITPVEPDSAADGLTDKQEDALGTDPNKADTDNDGLFDAEEVNIYHTDPLNPDTDQDGILDGAEVHQGMDPKNPDPNAKLLDLNKEINKL